MLQSVPFCVRNTCASEIHIPRRLNYHSVEYPKISDMSLAGVTGILVRFDSGITSFLQKILQKDYYGGINKGECR